MKQSDVGTGSIGLLRIWLSGSLLEATGVEMQFNKNCFTYRIYLRLRLTTLIETLIILDITKTESMNCFITH